MKSNKSIALKAVLLAAVLFTAALTACITASAAETYEYADVYLGDNIICAGESLLYDGEVFVPLDSFCRAMGGERVEWDSGSKTAAAYAPSLEISVTVGDTYICANGRYLCAESENMTIWGKLYVPLKTIAAAFDAQAEWHPYNGTAHVVSGSGAILPGDKFYNQTDLYWLSRIITAESRGEPLAGQIAVGNVVMNRVASDEFPSTVYGVIFDRKNAVQFTPAANGKINNTPTQTSIIAAKITLEGYKFSEDVIYFLNESVSKKNWITTTRTFVFKIGCHSFFA